jgi:uncharacterized protein with HEPN domain
LSSSVICDKILDILEAIEVVQKRTNIVLSPDDFTKDDDATVLFDSVLMRLQTIGETLKSIEKSDANFFAKFVDFDIESEIKFRDIISHHYADINPVIVFDICKNHLEKLKQKIKAMQQAICN